MKNALRSILPLILCVVLCLALSPAAQAEGPVITFDPNGGYGSMDAQAVGYGTATMLNANTYVRANYAFSHWNTQADGSGMSYADQGDITATGDMTLYAQWVKTMYTVSYDKNGGGGIMTMQSVQIGQSVKLKDSEFAAKPGMIFGYWNTMPDGSGASFAPGTSVMPAGDVTLYAQWKDPVNIYYYPGTGDGTYKIVQVPKDVETALKSPFDADLGYAAPSGQTFAHWLNNATGETYKRNQKVTFSDDVSLTAVYADTIAISYDPNGGSLTVNGTTSTTARKFAAPKGEPYTLYTAEQLHLTRSGYEFLGWGQYKSDKTVDYADGGTYIFSGDKELFALWQKHTFDGGVVIAGSISGSSYDAYVGETLTATAYDDHWKEFNYRWMRDDGVVLLDSTYPYPDDSMNWTKYVVQEDDYGHDIYCEVSAIGEGVDTGIIKQSNIKTVAVQEETKRIINNGNTEQDYVYGLTSDMTYTVNSTDSSKGTKVVMDTYGRFAVTQSGTYRFYKKGTLQATVYAENWYTISYAASGSGTVRMRLDNMTLTSSTRFTGDLADKIEYYPHIPDYNTWIVKEGASIGTFTLTVQPASGSTANVHLNGQLLDSYSGPSSSSSSSSSSSYARTYTVSTPLETDTRYTSEPWKIFSVSFTSSAASPITDFTVPDSLTEIGEEAFAGGAFHTVCLSKKTAVIGPRAFADCPRLTGIYIPNALAEIDPTAFDGVDTLKIYGMPGSTAEAFAKDHGFAFAQLPEMMK